MRAANQQMEAKRRATVLAARANGARGGVYVDERPAGKLRLLYDVAWRVSWLKMPSAPSEDSAPSASLDHLEAQAAPTHPGAPLGPL